MRAALHQKRWNKASQDFLVEAFGRTEIQPSTMTLSRSLAREPCPWASHGTNIKEPESSSYAHILPDHSPFNQNRTTTQQNTLSAHIFSDTHHINHSQHHHSHQRGLTSQIQWTQTVPSTTCPATRRTITLNSAAFPMYMVHRLPRSANTSLNGRSVARITAATTITQRLTWVPRCQTFVDL